MERRQPRQTPKSPDLRRFRADSRFARPSRSIQAAVVTRITLAVTALITALVVASCGGTEAPIAAEDCPLSHADATAGIDSGRPALDGLAADSTRAPPNKPSATERLFAPNAPLRTFDLDVAPKDWQWLKDNAIKEQYVACTVRSEGAKPTPAWVRFKGAYGSLFSCFKKQGPNAGEQTCKKLSLKVSFNRTQKKGRMFGVRKLILNSCNRDATCLHERLAYSLFREAGIEAPRAVHVRVRVNGGPASLYVLVENVDKEFLEDHFADPEGNLYKEAWPWGTTQAHTKMWLDALETNEKAADVSRLLAFAEAAVSGAKAADTLRSGGGANAQEAAGLAFAKAVDPWIDREAMTRYFVVDQLVNNWDGIWKFYCSTPMTCRNHNYFLYDHPASGQFVVVPWDLDHTFTEPNTDMARSWWLDGPKVCELDNSNPLVATRKPQCDPLLRGLMRSGWSAYTQQLDAWTKLGGPLDQAHLQARLDGYRAQIYDTVKDDPLGPGLVPWLSATAQFRETLTTQVDEARKVLAWPLP